VSRLDVQAEGGGPARREASELRLHYLQHVAFEDPANILPWAAAHGLPVTGTRLDLGQSLPQPDDYDWLVIMGGPMSVHDGLQYPWLAEEKECIAEAIVREKKVLGVCLGAQLIADVLGAKVLANAHREIGWFPVRLTPEAATSALFPNLPNTFLAFHWHGETFGLPPGAVHLAESEACRNQAFECNGGRVLGLQFHLESSLASIRRLIEHCGDELTDGPYIQAPEEMLGNLEYVARVTEVMKVVLDNMLSCKG
jgi:GMP synthase-like glutamine amidotransferase